MSRVQPPLKPRHWFPAKRYCWGWGLPSTWEGWVVLAVYLALLAALIVLVPADRYPNWFWAGFGTLITTTTAARWNGCAATSPVPHSPPAGWH